MELAVTFINSVRDTYGDRVEEVMAEHARTHPSSTNAVCLESTCFGLRTDDPAFMTAFAEAGGDVQYLERMAKAFVAIRTSIYGI